MKKIGHSILKNKKWEVPDFVIDEFARKKHKYVICVFVINEGEKLKKQIKEMQEYAKIIDIVIADGGSTDGSLEHEYLEKHKIRALLTKTGKGKLSAQMRMAFAWVLTEKYEGVITIDGNGKDDVSAIPDFIRKLDKGYDHIQGSRFIKGGKAVNTPIERLIAVKFIHAPIISLASRRRHTDTTNGFRGYSAKLLADSKISIFRDVFESYELHYYLAIEASRSQKYSVIEQPVTRVYPKGKTPTKISPIKGNMKVIKILIESTTGKYKMRDK